MSALARNGTRLPTVPLRPELAAYFVRPAPSQGPRNRDFRFGVLRDLFEQGLIR